MKTNISFRHVFLTIFFGALLVNFTSAQSIYYPRPAFVNSHAGISGEKSLEQKEVIWYEDFDGGLPDGWLSVDENDFCAFEHTYDGPQGPFSQGVPPINSVSAHNGFMILDSDVCWDNNPDGLTDAYLQSPPIDLSAHSSVMLSFQHFFRYCCSFENTIMEVQVSNDGENWTSFDVKNGILPNNLSPNPLHQYVNITEVAGGQSEVWIRFRKVGASHYFWMIDDVKISASLENDLEVFQPDYGGYTMIPGGQQQAFIPGAGVRNLGANPQTNVKLEVKINEFLFQEIGGPIASLPSGASEVLKVGTTFTLPFKGLYEIEYVVKQDQEDQNPSNNLLAINLQVTDTIYARDRGIYSGEGIWGGEDATYITGNRFGISQNVQLTSVAAAFHENSAADAPVRARLYKKQGGNFSAIAQSEYYLLQPGDISNAPDQEAVWVTFSFTGNDLLLEEGSEYLAAIEFAGGDYPAVVAAEMPGGKISNGAFTRLEGFWQSEPKTPLIRMNFGENMGECQILFEAEVTDAYCGAEDGEATIYPLTGFSPYTFSWQTDPPQNGPTATGLSAGFYEVEITDATGCQDIIVVEIGNQELMLETESIPSGCGAPNGQATVIPVEGMEPYTYLWDTDPPQTTQTAEGLLPGTYSVLVTDSSGCEGTAEVTVEENDYLLVDITSQNPYCTATNGSILLEPVGGNPPFVFEWDDFPGVDTGYLENIPAGTYSVMVYDQLNCESQMEITLETEDTGLELQPAVTNETCQEENAMIDLNVTGGEEPLNFFWNTGHEGPVLENVGAGTYEVTVTDIYGCYREASFEITNQGEQPQVEAQVTHSPGCGQSGGSINLTPVDPEAGYDYLWSGGEQTPAIENLPAGTYVAEITEPQYQCLLEKTFYVNDDGSPGINSHITHISCHGETDGAIQITMDEDANDPQFNWNTGDNTPSIDDLPAGWYTLTVTDGDCVAAETYEVIEPDLLGVDYVVTHVSCYGKDDGKIALQATGGTSPFSFYWTSGKVGPVIDSLTAGNYSVMVTDYHYCTYDRAFEVLEPDMIVVDAEVVIPDPGQSNGSIELEVSGGTGGYTYTWSNGSNNPAIYNLPVGDYTVMVTDDSGCTVVKTFNLGTTNMDDLSARPDITIYPNPVDDHLQIRFENPGSGKLSVSLLDINGKPIRNMGSRNFAAGEQMTLFLSGLNPGVYVLNISGTGLMINHKIIKR